ncbi:MAG: hypothetical protein LIP11_02530, partial [Clostridiales bacterium]|nr:hypothetical protein [Clostridiales bacterium]
VIEPLCSELGITVAELMDGENAADNSVRTYDEALILDLIKRTQILEKDKNIQNGVLLIVMGIALLFLHYCVGGDGGSIVMDFISGLLLGISIPVMLVGTYVAARERCGGKGKSAYLSGRRLHATERSIQENGRFLWFVVVSRIVRATAEADFISAKQRAK